MQLHLDKFFEQWDASSKPYWVVREGHGSKGTIKESNLEIENHDESRELLKDFFGAYESGKATIITKSSPKANNTCQTKVYWGEVSTGNSRTMQHGGSGNMNTQLMMFMMQQQSQQQALMMQMMNNSNKEIQAERERIAQMQIDRIEREHEFFKERLQIESENGGSPWDEAMYGLAGAATPLALGLASKLTGMPVAALQVPQVGVGSTQAETDNSTEIEGEMGVKGAKEKPAAQAQKRGFSMDRLYLDASGIAKHFPNVHPNDIFLMMRRYLDQNPAMAPMLLQQIQTAKTNEGAGQ